MTLLSPPPSHTNNKRQLLDKTNIIAKTIILNAWVQIIQPIISFFFTSLFLFYKIKLSDTKKKNIKWWKEWVVSWVMWCQWCAWLKKIKKERESEYFELEVPAQQKITVEGKAKPKCPRFLPPLYHPQHMNAHTNTSPAFSTLCSPSFL